MRYLFDPNTRREQVAQGSASDDPSMPLTFVSENEQARREQFQAGKAQSIADGATNWNPGLMTEQQRALAAQNLEPEPVPGFVREYGLADRGAALERRDRVNPLGPPPVFTTPTTTDTTTTTTTPPATDTPPPAATPAETSLGPEGIQQLVNKYQQPSGWNPNIPLMVAGLGMMASERPDFLGALGEGGLLGAKTHIEMTEAEKNRREKQLDRDADFARAGLIASARASGRGGITGSEARAQYNAIRGILEERTSLFADQGITMSTVDQFMNAYLASGGDLNAASQIIENRRDRNSIANIIKENFMDDWLTVFNYERLVTSGMGAMEPSAEDPLDFTGFESVGAE
jgi:hypothetical protein